MYGFNQKMLLNSFWGKFLICYFILKVENLFLIFGTLQNGPENGVSCQIYSWNNLTWHKRKLLDLQASLKNEEISFTKNGEISFTNGLKTQEEEEWG